MTNLLTPQKKKILGHFQSFRSFKKFGFFCNSLPSIHRVGSVCIMLLCAGRLISTLESYFSSPSSASAWPAVCSSPLNLTPPDRNSCLPSPPYLYYYYLSSVNNKDYNSKPCQPPASQISHHSFLLEKRRNSWRQWSQWNGVRLSWLSWQADDDILIFIALQTSLDHNPSRLTRLIINWQFLSSFLACLPGWKLVKPPGEWLTSAVTTVCQDQLLLLPWQGSTFGTRQKPICVLMRIAL